MNLSYRDVFDHYGITLKPYEHETGAAIGTDPKTQAQVLVMAVFDDLFSPDYRSVNDNIHDPRWGKWAQSEQGSAFIKALTIASAKNLPVHVYRAERRAERYHVFTLMRDRGRILVGRVTVWNGSQYRIELS